MDNYGLSDLTLDTFIMERLTMEPNTVVEKRQCERCNGWSVVTWYTKRGRQNVQCMKCGKVWDIYNDKRKES